MHKKWISVVILIGALQTALAEEPLKYNPNDPYEDYNRHAYKMNKKLDQVIFRPVASLYKAVTPTPLRKGINNFLTNLSQVPTVINDVLQGNLHRAGTDLVRFTVNTTVGLGGFIDIATCMGIEKNPQDFCLRLAKWGYRCSNYFVLPILGPSTIRDTINWPIYYQMTVYPYIPGDALRNGLLALDYTDERTQLLDLDPVIEQSFDPYVFERDAYLQRRNFLIRKNQGLCDKDAAITPSLPTPDDKDKTDLKKTGNKI